MTSLYKPFARTGKPQLTPGDNVTNPNSSNNTERGGFAPREREKHTAGVGLISRLRRTVFIEFVVVVVPFFFFFCTIHGVHVCVCAFSFLTYLSLSARVYVCVSFV